MHKTIIAIVLTLCIVHTNIASAAFWTSSVSMKDFLVQDVCLDKKGNVLPLPPTDASCKKTRELTIGEKLPYHKHDHNGTDTNPEAANVKHWATYR